MIWLYFKIAIFVCCALSVLVTVFPLSYWAIMYLKHVGEGNDFGSWDIGDDPLYKNLDDFFDSVSADWTDERVSCILVMMIMISLLWVIGVPIFVYWLKCIIKKVKNDLYEEATNKPKSEV